MNKKHTDNKQKKTKKGGLLDGIIKNGNSESDKENKGEKKFVSRAGAKLDHAMKQFKINIKCLVCADLGCSTGGFVDCLLQHGAKKVYAVDTGYGVLEWKLRNDNRVKVMERTNALHAKFPEEIDLISIDAGWTLQKHIIPAALGYLKPSGQIITLIKPHYEAGRKALKGKKIPDEDLPEIIDKVKEDLSVLPIEIKGLIESPILGGKGGNKEFLMFLSRV